MMKMVKIVFNISLEAEVRSLLEKTGAACFTQWPRLIGRGKSTGAKFDNDVWPGANSAIMVVADEAQAGRLMDAIQALRDEIGEFEGIKGFQLAVEKMTGDF